MSSDEAAADDASAEEWATRYEVLLETSLDAIVIARGASGIRALSRSAEALFGWTASELQGQPLSALLRDVREEAGAEGWSSQGVSDPDRCYRVTGLRKDGTSFPALLRLSRRDDGGEADLAIVRDLSKSEAREAALAQADRLAALGLLAASVAHDFNNALSALRAQFYIAQVQGGGPLPLAEWHAIVDRCASLTRWLLALSLPSTAPSAGVDEVVDLRCCVTDALKGVQGLLPGNIGFALDLGSEPAFVALDPNLIVHALVNLVLNARDALARGGTIAIALRAGAGDHYELSVEDSGQGMSSEVVRRAFEPFFTTKAPGQGTGLGLASVLRIVERARGSVAIASEPGRGTRVTLRLPRSAEGGARRARGGLPGVSAGSEKLAKAGRSKEPLRTARRQSKR